MVNKRKVIVYSLLFILLIGVVGAWSYVGLGGGVYKLTLDTGKVVNISNISISGSQNVKVSAVVTAKNLTIQDAINIKQIEQNISDQLNGKKNYSISLIILNTK